ncbi:acyltransferase family protein [Mycolicibacterium sp. CH28]|uniref:acyltransferase family protein n=1 Tax=Mycolicibacterium sp. CH28 TaxID=2512237 RepID=UPI001F262896|nr:acyltransferase family protein [Mycolicibacterium sp. CH28]
MALAHRRSRSDFRPDIEGLRAVAVVAVVAFHARLGIGGGFIGVDVFFVISGFLITRLLVSEVSTTDTVNLARFYGARARRLLPAAGTVAVVTAVAAATLLPPVQARSVLGDALASALYVGNYRFAAHGTDYLADTLPSPFQHYWSLGVEEQFYLLWPAVILGAAWLVRRAGRRASVPYFAGALLVVAVSSFALALVWTQTSPPWAFFSLPSRAWELAAGGLVALSAPLWRRLGSGPAAVAGIGGLALIAATCLQLDEQTPYPGTAALLPVLGTALVIGAGCATPIGGAGRWLSLPWMRELGRLSYSLYLWHWPVLIFVPILAGRELGVIGRLVAVSASFALAVLTLRYIERPVRRSIPLRRSAGRSLALGSAVTASAVAAALLLPVFVPASVGHGNPAPTAAVEVRGSDPLADAIAGIAAAVAASAQRHDVPSNLTPPLDDAVADKPSVFVNGCVRSWLDTGVPECASGDVAAPTTVALVGDSHAAMWQPALEDTARQQHWRLETMAKITCPIQGAEITSPYLGREYTECRTWRAQVFARLRAERPKLIVVSMARRYGADFGFTTYDRGWLDSLKALVIQLRSTTGARVLVLGPVPDPHSAVPVCLSAHLTDTRACTPARPVAMDPTGIAAERAAVHTGGGQYADLSPLFCTDAVCPVIIGRDLVFRDDNHITVPYAQTLGPVLGMIAEQAIAPRS